MSHMLPGSEKHPKAVKLRSLRPVSGDCVGIAGSSSCAVAADSRPTAITAAVRRNPFMLIVRREVQGIGACSKSMSLRVKVATAVVVGR